MSYLTQHNTVSPKTLTLTHFKNMNKTKCMMYICVLQLRLFVFGLFFLDASSKFSREILIKLSEVSQERLAEVELSTEIIVKRTLGQTGETAQLKNTACSFRASGLIHSTHMVAYRHL